MQDTSIPSPSDPEKADSADQEGNTPSTPRKPLKLKRIVVEKTEIHPHKKAGNEPTPEAQPYIEPEEEEEPLPEVLQKQPPSPEPEPVPQPVPAEEPGPQEEETEEPDLPVASAPAKQSEKPASSIRRIAYIVVPAAVLVAILLVLNMIFDPFGEDLAPIQPQRTPEAREAVTEVAESPPPAPSSLEVSEIPEQSGKASIQDFLQALKTQKLNVSGDPKGLFVDSIFIPEGETVHPDLGLFLSSVTPGTTESFAVLRSASGESFPLTIVSE